MLICAEPLSGHGWRGLPLMRLRVPPTAPAPLRIVERPMLMALTRGSVRLHHGRSGMGPTGEPRTGDVSLLPPQADYEGVRWSNAQPSEYLAAELPIATCESWLQRRPDWTRPGQPATRFDDPRVLQWLRELEDHCVGGEPFGALYTEAVSTTLLSYLDARFGGAPQAARAARPDPLSARALERVRHHIEERLGEPLRAAELAAIGGYSPQHFNRVFKAAFGMPLHHYVLQRRVELARQLLAKDGMSLAEIALACGFSSQGHFGLVFKTRTGMAPNQYRRSLRG